MTEQFRVRARFGAASLLTWARTLVTGSVGVKETCSSSSTMMHKLRCAVHVPPGQLGMDAPVAVGAVGVVEGPGDHHLQELPTLAVADVGRCRHSQEREVDTANHSHIFTVVYFGLPSRVVVALSPSMNSYRAFTDTPGRRRPITNLAASSLHSGERAPTLSATSILICRSDPS